MLLRVVEGATERETQRDPLRLRELWRAASLRAGWAYPVDWWAPEVEAVVDAVVDGRDLVAPCAQLGRARADAGVGLDEALTDLAALPAPGAGAKAPLVRALATGWADVACDPATMGICEDPFTGLTTPAYLRTRLAEAYREADRAGTPVTSSHALVVVGTDGAGESQLSTSCRLLVVGAVLRDTFSGGETLARIGPAHAVALAARDTMLAPRVAVAARLLSERLRRAGGAPARVWIERLPPALPAAYHLLTELAR